MHKIWDLMPKEAKTKVMALRHYMDKKENNKEGKTMRVEGNKLVFEEADLNAALAYSIREHQFHNRNEMPEVMVVEVPACVTGKDRNEQDYAVEILVVRVGNGEGVPSVPEPEPESERGVDADGQPNPPEAVPGNDGTPEEVEAEKAKMPESTVTVLEGSPATMQPEEATEAGSENETAPVVQVDEVQARQEAKAVGLKVTADLGDYRCSQCNRMHLSGSKIHKRHLKYKA